MKRTKLLLLTLILVLAVPALVSAQSDDMVWGSYFHPGNFAVSLAVGWGYGWSIAFYPGVEFILAEVSIADTVPIQFGIAGKGLLNWYNTSSAGFDWGWFAFGVGALGTAHLSFKELDLEVTFLDKIDVYVGLGVGISFYSYTGDWDLYGLSGWDTTRFSFVTMSGINYFINERLAIYLEGTYFSGYYGGGSVGILYKLGKK